MYIRVLRCSDVLMAIAQIFFTKPNKAQKPPLEITKYNLNLKCPLRKVKVHANYTLIHNQIHNPQKKST